MPRRNSFVIGKAVDTGMVHEVASMLSQIAVPSAILGQRLPKVLCSNEFRGMAQMARRKTLGFRFRRTGTQKSALAISLLNKSLIQFEQGTEGNSTSASQKSECNGDGLWFQDSFPSAILL